MGWETKINQNGHAPSVRVVHAHADAKRAALRRVGRVIHTGLFNSASGDANADNSVTGAPITVHRGRRWRDGDVSRW